MCGSTDHTLAAWDASTYLVKSRLSLATAEGIDDVEVSFKDHDEGKASAGGTPGREESRVASSGDVRMSDPTCSGNMTTRGSVKRHADGQGCERMVYRHGAILLIVRRRRGFNPRRCRH